MTPTQHSLALVVEERIAELVGRRFLAAQVPDATPAKHGYWCVQHDKGDSAEPMVHGPDCRFDDATPPERAQVPEPSLDETKALRNLRRKAVRARGSWVAQHWPTARALERDGSGVWFQEKREDRPALLSFLAAVAPEEVIAAIDSALAATRLIPRHHGGSRMTKPEPIEEAGAAAERAKVEGLRAKVVGFMEEAERRSNVHMAAKEWERSDRAAAQVAAFRTVVETIDRAALSAEEPK